MKTSKISLFYSLTPTKVIPPAEREVERKERWLKEMQKTVEAEWKPKIIKNTYELFDPEIENQKRFFEGAVVEYYAIQDMDLFEGKPDSETLGNYREELLDEMLGYNLNTTNKIIRKRKSTTDFKDVQAWNTFLKTLEETIFAIAGYEFPDSKNFWELSGKHGYDEAKRIAIEQLQARLKKRYDK